MRTIKLIADVLIVIVVLPVVITAVLGIAFSPLQPVARASEPQVVLQVSDIALNASASTDVSEAA